MEQLFDVNGLMFWSGRDLWMRRTMADYFHETLRDTLWAANSQWSFHQIEAPILTPRWLLNPNYTAREIWRQHVAFFDEHADAFITVVPDVHDPRDLALRPETTPGSYVYAQHLLNTHSGVKPPFCVWQIGKSFRREPDQPSKHMRLKEFYQQEFQCIYTADTANDYHAVVCEPVRKMLADMIGLDARLVASDRLPSYSQVTMDVEVNNGDKWMEVCSISRRTDFPQKIAFQGKAGKIEKDVLVLEVAIGLDRVVYNWNVAHQS